MSVEENKAVVRQYVESIGKGDISAVEELTTSNFVMHALGAGRDIDREALKQTREVAKAGFPDSTATVEDIIAEDDKVNVRITIRATHTGQYQKIAPTNRKISFARYQTFLLESGKIKEVWNLQDRYGMYEQLGVIPPTTELGK